MANYSSGLQYLHPHISTSVVDNSSYVETVVATKGTKLFMPIFCDKGLDSKIQVFSSQTQLIAEYGLPNFKEHGQAYYNALNFARGGGLVYAIRLLPVSATYANQCFYVNFGEGVEVGGSVVEQEQLTKRYIVFATDDEVQPEYKSMPSTDEVVEGEEVVVEDSLKMAVTKSLQNPRAFEAYDDKEGRVPVLSVYSKGRGQYGNNIAVSLEVESSLADSYGFAVYNLRVFEVVNGGNILVEGPYHVALFPEAVNAAGNSLYIKNIVDRYSSRISVEVSEAGLDAVYDHLQELYEKEQEALKKEALENGTDYIEQEFMPYSIDILGMGTGSNNALYTILEGGNDGGAGKNGRLTDAEKTKLLVAAYNGLSPFDTNIAHKREFPIDILLDANFPNEVKEDMAALASKRGDCIAILDCGLKPLDAQTAVNLKPQIDTPYAAVYGQSATIYDSFTNSYIPVTMPFFLAAKIPANDETYGIQYPIAGPTRGTVTGFQSLSFNPYMDDKELLYKNRVNYLEQDYRQSKFMTQLTSQSKSSALSNINNVRVLMAMVRNVEDIANNYYFEFANNSTLGNMQSTINSYLSSWVSNGACKVAEGLVYQNEYDHVQKIVRVRIEVVFVNVIERIVIEFNVGN